MACKVYLQNAIERNIGVVLAWIKVMISRRDVDVIHIEHHVDARFLYHFGVKLPLWHLIACKGDIGGEIFESKRDFQKVLDDAGAFGHIVGCRVSIGEWQKVMKVGSIQPAPGEMVGEPGSLCFASERL